MILMTQSDNRYIIVILQAIAVAAIVSSTCLTFSWIFFNESDIRFQVPWDDDDNYIDNKPLRSSCGKGLNWEWPSMSLARLGVYEPFGVLIKSFVGCAFGFKPTAIMTASLLFHSSTALLLYNLSFDLIAIRNYANINDLPSAIIAHSVSAISVIIFACHPARGEIIGWSSCLPYSISLFCSVMGTACYIKMLSTKNFIAIGILAFISTVGFASAFFSKVPSVATPFLLLFLHVSGHLPLPQSSANFAAAFSSFLYVISAMGVSIYMTVLATRPTPGGMVNVQPFSALMHARRVLYSLAFNVGIVVVPVRVSPLYLWPVSGFDSDDWDVAGPIAIAATVISLSVFVAVVRTVQRLNGWVRSYILSLPRIAAAASGTFMWPSVVTVVLGYTLLCAPVLAGLHGYPMASADRYTYFPSAFLSVAAIVFFVEALCTGGRDKPTTHASIDAETSSTVRQLASLQSEIAATPTTGIGGGCGTNGSGSGGGGGGGINTASGKPKARPAGLHQRRPVPLHTPIPLHTECEAGTGSSADLSPRLLTTARTPTHTTVTITSTATATATATATIPAAAAAVQANMHRRGVWNPAARSNWSVRVLQCGTVAMLAMLALFLSSETFVSSQMWIGGETLWRTTLTKYANHPFAARNLGYVLMTTDKLTEEITSDIYSIAWAGRRQAIDSNPKYALPEKYYGNLQDSFETFVGRSMFAQAKECVAEALAAFPMDATWKDRERLLQLAISQTKQYHQASMASPAAGVDMGAGGRTLTEKKKSKRSKNKKKKPSTASNA